MVGSPCHWPETIEPFRTINCYYVTRSIGIQLQEVPCQEIVINEEGLAIELSKKILPNLQVELCLNSQTDMVMGLLQSNS